MDRTYQKFLRSGIDLAPIGVERLRQPQDVWRFACDDETSTPISRLAIL